jgi:hypothetical protein
MAREILFLLSTLLLCILFYISLIGYNQLKSNKNDLLESDLKNIEYTYDSLMKNHKSKIDNQKWLHEKFYNNYSKSYKTYDALWDRLVFLYTIDSISVKYNKIWSKETIDFFTSVGLNSSHSLNDFVENNSLTSEETNQIKRLEFDKETIKRESEEIIREKLTTNEKVARLLAFLWTLLIILFLFRYIYYTIIWSIKILKT